MNGLKLLALMTALMAEAYVDTMQVELANVISAATRIVPPT